MMIIYTTDRSFKPVSKKGKKYLRVGALGLAMLIYAFSIQVGY